MTEKTEFAQGEPTWVDLSTSDPGAASTFYATLFGWTAEPVPMPDAGGYTMMTLDGRHVAGLGPLQNEHQPPSWAAYIAVDDVDKTSELVQSAGGTIAAPAMDVFDSGRMAVFQDPTGAFISVWQAKEHKGAGIIDVPGALTWIELTTSDTAKAKAFYTEVFGWGVKESSEAGGIAYTEYTLGDQSIAGMMAKPEGMPAEIPSYWMPYFQVADVDKAFGEVTALGGNAMVPPTDIPTGLRFAVVTDPQGAVFGLLTNTST